MVVTPPALGGPWVAYNLTLCPMGNGACVKTSCSTPASCPVTGLTPNTTYYAVVGCTYASTLLHLSESLQLSTLSTTAFALGMCAFHSRTRERIVFTFGNLHLLCRPLLAQPLVESVCPPTLLM